MSDTAIYRVLCMQCGHLLAGDDTYVPVEQAAKLQAVHTRCTEHRVVLLVKGATP